MVVLLFLTQLLCAVVPCDPKFNEPEISIVPDNSFANRIGRSSDGNDTEYVHGPPNFIVETNTGKVEGFEMTSAGREFIYAFEGIPYAEPPVGINRFRPPLPKLPWEGVLPAKHLGHPCLQLSPVKLYRTLGREDCLTLNVYSSQLPHDGKSPNLSVLIWVHGGAYLFGEGGDYGPSYLLNKEIVLVTINYRLGILGFLSTGDEASPGNNGLRDQALAIKWVHENIAKFGGDVNRVTLMGHSAGGASTHLHMMSNTQKYFQSAISLSGTAFNNWAMASRNTARKYLNKIAKIFKCPTANGDLERNVQTMGCLRSKNPNTLVGSQFKLLEWGPFPLILFAPVVEKLGPNAMITRTPEDAYAQKEVAKIPWISSLTKEEGLFQLLLVYGNLKIPEYRSQWAKAARVALDLNHVENPIETTNQIREFYFKDKPLKSASYARLSDPITDRFFVNGIHKSLVEHSVIAPTYSYVFDFLGKHNVANYLGLEAKEWGIGHTEDVFYIFNSSRTYNGFSKRDEAELELSNMIINILTNFVSKGKPLYTDEEGNTHKIWSPYSNASKTPFLQIGLETKMIPDPFKARREFWERLKIKDELL